MISNSIRIQNICFTLISEKYILRNLNSANQNLKIKNHNNNVLLLLKYIYKKSIQNYFD